MNTIHNNLPANYATEIARQFSETFPLDIYRVCEYFDIKIYKEPLRNAEALLIVSNCKKSIVLNQHRALYAQRERFTIAHELGHLFIPWHENQISCKSSIGKFDASNIIEHEADIFASELLIPTNILRNLIFQIPVSTDLIKELSCKFNVSLSAMSRKVLSVTNDKAVFIYRYKNRFIEQARSESFNYNFKNSTNKDSIVKTLLEETNQFNCTCRVLDLNNWFLDNDNKMKIIEYSIPQPNFHRVFTIIRVTNDFSNLEYNE